MTTAAISPGACVLFEQAFGAPWRRGPIPTALDVLESSLKRSGAWQSPRTMPEPARRGGTEVPLLWARELSPHELTRRWVVSIDKHAAYLAVLGGLELGIGNPRRDDRPEVGRHRCPGYWKVRCSFPPPETVYPDPLGRDRRGEPGPFWVTTPTLELAIEQGLEVYVLESWTWPNHRRVLRPFAARVNAARRWLQAYEGPDAHAAAEAAAMLKDVYAPILGGFLARLADRRLAQPPPWYRPDWRHQVIAKARANLLRAMAQWRPLGYYPIGAYNDAVYFASDESGAALAGALEVQVDQLGGYALGATRELREVVGEDRRLSFPRMFRRA